MKHRFKTLSLFLALILLLLPLTGCGSNSEGGQGQQQTQGQTTAGDAAFSYSEGIDENGFWTGVTALDHLDLVDYQAIEIPADTHRILDEDVQSRIAEILTEYPIERQITDRAVEEFDSVNIDYVGSIDGVEFSGGNTQGGGATVTIGVTSYIDDFLEQIIGHMPGETFDVNVTFPDPYPNNTDLSGKDAVFVTTVNYIVDSTEPELTDAFVAENLSAGHGWTTVAEMNAGIYEELRDEAVLSYIQAYLLSGVSVRSLPEQLVQYQNNVLIKTYQDYAAYTGMELEEFLATYMGISSVNELLASNYDYVAEGATYFLILQAIAEDTGMTVSTTDVSDYFLSYVGTTDYSQAEELFGMPYIKQATLCQMVLNHLLDHAVLL